MWLNTTGRQFRSSDYIIDLGPGAGEHGGKVVMEGETKKLLNSDNGFDSLTLSYLRSRGKIKIPEERRKGNGKFITLTKRREITFRI